MEKTTKLVYVGIFIALNVILTRFFAIEITTLRVSCGIIPIVFSSIMFGPLIGGITGAVSDIIGMMLFPKGAYFPGFTLTAFLSGVFYGVFLYKKSITVHRVLLCLLVTTIVLSLGLNTYWLVILTGKGFIALLPQRIIKDIIMLPINTFLVYVSWKYVGNTVTVNSSGLTSKN